MLASKLVCCRIHVNVIKFGVYLASRVTIVTVVFVLTNCRIMYQASRDYKYAPQPISCCKGQHSGVQSDNQNLRVNCDTAMYTTSKKLCIMKMKSHIALTTRPTSFLSHDSWKTKNKLQ